MAREYTRGGGTFMTLRRRPGTVVQVRCNDDLIARVRRYAVLEDCSVAELVRRGVRAELDRMRQRYET